jgi:hypothetical protein
MTSRFALLAAIGTFTALITAPATLHGVQPAQSEHDQHHPSVAAAPEQATPKTPDTMMAAMMAKDVKLEELVKKMISATGSAKTEAIAELLTALVEDHRTMCGPMMANKMSMMNRMDGAGHDHEASAAPHK